MLCYLLLLFIIINLCCVRSQDALRVMKQHQALRCQTVILGIIWDSFKNSRYINICIKVMSTIYLHTYCI